MTGSQLHSGKSQEVGVESSWVHRSDSILSIQWVLKKNDQDLWSFESALTANQFLTIEIGVVGPEIRIAAGTPADVYRFHIEHDPSTSGYKCEFFSLLLCLKC